MKKTQTPSEKMAQWMKLMNLIDREVAEATGVDVAHVWRIRTGAVSVPDSFAWKFAKAYGYNTAKQLFLDNERIPA